LQRIKASKPKGAIFCHADWIAGVDYDANIYHKEDNNKAYEDENNKDPKEEQDIDKDQYNWINEDKLEDQNEDARQDDNHNQHLEQDKVAQDVQEEDGSKDEGTPIISEPESNSQASGVRRSMRTSQPVSQLGPNMSGKLYMQNNKKKRKVSFVKDKKKQLEYCHNLVAQVRPADKKITEYGSNQSMLVARFIQDITMHVNLHRASFVQQYILQKGLKVFGKKGPELEISDA
jgi:hypothetical protein